ncbi:calcium-binding protein [Colwellia psychrerythraea]|uniref:Hemolysin-type calcium binding domain protein n=1 Tax=Colwellia psychrerythraea TaxID=28229 RepID=A0A099KF81_COLPS|nr:calcium-binding protein [Colwellia psychrerythraea]KGJ88617.1 Hemolysin-type calcium binding domain protein [Colwellia psychrerythraea]
MGGGNDDRLYGGAGNDTLVGGDGIDILYGGTGDDYLFVGKGGIHVTSPTSGTRLGTEIMDGGEGFDTYFIGTYSNETEIKDSDGMGQIITRVDDFSDVGYIAGLGTFWGEQTITDRPEGDIEADGYTQIHYDGRTSNYTVAYELDGSKTLISYGFNIPNFYNGMLGINLVGGRVDTGIYSIEAVLDKIVMDEEFAPSEQQTIRDIIINSYNESPTARAMMNNFAIKLDNDININYVEGDMYASVDGIDWHTSNSADNTVVGTSSESPNGIYLDLSFLEDYTYISTTGKAVSSTLEFGIIHELAHLMTGYYDTVSTGLKGDNVTFANGIYKEMGIPEQLSYEAHAKDEHTLNFEYTQGKVVDRALTLREDLGIDSLDFTNVGESDDLLIGNFRANTLIAGAGNDFIYGNEGNDIIYGNEGNDYLVAGLGNDSVYGGSDNDTLYGDEGDDDLYGNEGSDSLAGGLGEDNIYGGDGNDSLNGGADDDYLDGGDGDDSLTGGLGKDSLTGGLGDDTYVFSKGDGQDIYQEVSGTNDSIHFTDISSSEVVVKYKNNGELDVNIIGSSDQINIIQPESDNDLGVLGFESFVFSDGVVWDAEMIQANALGSTDTDDVIIGSDSNDSLIGGLGNDVIYGGLGNDNYVFSVGDGQDTYVERNGDDTISFINFNSTELKVNRDITEGYHYSDDIVFSFMNSTDQVTLRNVSSVDYPHNIGFENFTFADGVTLNYQDIYEKLMQGSDGEDTIYGYASDDQLSGYEGDDFLFGQEGNDTLNGGGGNDVLLGGSGGDVYLFNSIDGRDEIIDSKGEDSIQFGEGITASDLHIVYSADEIYISLLSDDSQSENSITIRRTYANNTIEKLVFANGEEVLWDVTTQTYDSENIDIEIVDPEVENPDAEEETYTYENTIYDDGAESVLYGTIQDDLFIGTSGWNYYYINAGSGHDTIKDTSNIIGGIEDKRGDLCLKGVNDEFIWAERDGNDMVIFMADRYGARQASSVRLVDQYIGLGVKGIRIQDGNQDSWGSTDYHDLNFNELFRPAIEPYSNVEGTEGSDGLIGTFGDDILNGYGDSDELEGRSGNDTLNGGGGNDYYYFSLGDGKDIINDISGVDEIEFSGIRPDNIRISQDFLGQDVIIKILDDNGTLTGDKITIQNALVNTENQIEKLFFDFDDSSVNWDDIYQASILLTEPKADTVRQVRTGTEGDDHFDDSYSTEGYIYKTGGGTDTVQGGIASDDYDFDGPGSLRVRDNDGQDNTVSGGWGWIRELSRAEVLRLYANGRLQSGRTRMGMTLSYDGDFTISNSGEGSIIFVDNNLTQLSFNQLNFLDGTSWDTTEILANTVVMGTDDDDSINYQYLSYGTNYDTGLGNDIVSGGTGDDSYLFDIGDGNDVISDSSGSDTLLLGVGITPENILVQANERDMLISFASGETVTITNWYSSYSSRIEQFEFADGTTWNAADILANMVIAGSDGDDTINNQYLLHSTTYNTGLGNDSIYGGKGDDAYLYNLGDGNDTINDYGGSDIIRFGAGITADNISVSANEKDMLITLSDGQVITITSWYHSYSSRIEQFEFADGTTWAAADILGNMVVTGTDGDDSINNQYLLHSTTYETSVGNDSVYGGKGDDAYLYNLGDGNDTINDYSGSDILRFGAGITVDNISVSAENTDMLITLSDGQVITIANWNHSNNSRIEQFEFADGTIWDGVDILANMVIAGSDGDGYVNNQYLRNGTTYDMGLGDDRVYGGKGDDAYLYNLGDGNDTINDYSGSDILRFGVGITADNISVSVNHSDLLITLSDEQVITLVNGYSPNSLRIEQFEFSDGTVWETTDIFANIGLSTAESSSTDSNLNLLIQSYSSFDDASDDSGLELSKTSNSIVLPVIESIM